MWANYSTHHVHAYERIFSHLLTENENRTTERMTQRKLYSVIHFMSQQHTHTIYMQTLVFFYFPPFHLSLFLSSESQSATNENFNERNAMKFKIRSYAFLIEYKMNKPQYESYRFFMVESFPFAQFAHNYRRT